MSDAQKPGLRLLAIVVAFGVAIAFGASHVSAYADVERISADVELGVPVAWEDSWPTILVQSPPQTLVPFQIARGGDEEDSRVRRRERSTAPPEFEVRRHEQPIKRVIRRSATPIPRISNSRKKRRSDYYGYGSHGYYSGYHYYHAHRHHAHCGHDYYWDQGDEFESRTLGRSCIYGPKGEVIYKPEEVVCAPDETATPATAPGSAADPAAMTPATSEPAAASPVAAQTAP